MVAGFHRSLSLPGRTNPNPSDDGAAAKPHHARSASLPSPSHPALSHLHHQICSLRSWPQAPPPPAKDHIAARLLAIARLHAAVDDLLHLPLALDPLRRAPAPWADRLLDDLLRLADAHASFRSAAPALRQHQSEARAAIRRRDPGRLASGIRAHRRAEKDLSRLASAVKGLGRAPPLAPVLASDDAEVAGVIREAVAATATASAAVFAGVAAVSSAAATAAASALKGSSMAGTLRLLSAMRKRSCEAEAAAEMAALERLEAVEECIEGLEKGSERILRSLMNARVSLLNILTPSL